MKTTKHLVKGPPYYWGDAMLSMMTQAKSLLSSVGQETKVSNCIKNIDWERTGYNKDRWEDVVKAFGGRIQALPDCYAVLVSIGQPL